MRDRWSIRGVGIFPEADSQVFLPLEVLPSAMARMCIFTAMGFSAVLPVNLRAAQEPVLKLLEAELRKASQREKDNC